MYSKPQPTQNSSQKLDLISRKEIGSLFSVFPWLLDLCPDPSQMLLSACPSAGSHVLPHFPWLSLRAKPLCPAASLSQARDKNVHLLLPCCLMFKCSRFMGLASDYILVAFKEDRETKQPLWWWLNILQNSERERLVWLWSLHFSFWAAQSPPPREDGCLVSAITGRALTGQQMQFCCYVHSLRMRHWIKFKKKTKNRVFLHQRCL